MLHLLEGEALYGAPAFIFGLVAFGILVVGLGIVRAIGSGRPHTK